MASGDSPLVPLDGPDCSRPAEKKRAPFASLTPAQQARRRYERTRRRRACVKLPLPVADALRKWARDRRISCVEAVAALLGVPRERADAHRKPLPVMRTAAEWAAGLAPLPRDRFRS